MQLNKNSVRDSNKEGAKRKKTVRWTVFADVVRSRARPADDEASVTKRSGRKLSALQADNNFREPQEAERSEAIARLCGTKSLTARHKKTRLHESVTLFFFYDIDKNYIGESRRRGEIPQIAFISQSICSEQLQ